MGFMGDPTDDMQDVSPSEDKNSGGKGILVLLAILLLPSAVTFGIFYSLLRQVRLRISVIFSILVVFHVFLFAIWSFSDLGPQFVDAILHISDFKENWGQLVFPLIIIYASIGAVLGFFATVWESRKLIKEPHRLEIKSYWSYNFKYRRTPFQFFNLQRKIKKLKSGELVDQKKAPLGVEVENDSFVYRYYSEAKTHTLISGGTGSGKALHEDTLIPTSKGFKNVSEVSVGDTLFDENGKETKVLGKYQPMTEDHYQLVFDNSEIVKACGEHLWKVSINDLEPSVINTREIHEHLLNGDYVYIDGLAGAISSFNRANNTFVDFSFLRKVVFNNDSSFDYDFDLKKLFEDYCFVSSLEKEFLLESLFAEEIEDNKKFEIVSQDKEIVILLRKIIDSLGWDSSVIEASESSYSFNVCVNKTRIGRKIRIESALPVSDDPEKYFCFEVDSPSHLFLCTESFIPTHNTITMQSLIYADIQNQVPTIVIDLKRSPEFASKLSIWSKENGCDFYHFVNGKPENYDIKDSDGPVRYDPLAAGTSTSKADMVLGMREYDTASAVYKANMQQLLQVLFSMLEVASTHDDRYKSAKKVLWDNGGLYNVASVVASVANFEDVVNLCEGTSIYDNAVDVLNQIKGKTGLRHALEELQGQMRTLLGSEYRDWFRTGPGRKGISLYELSSKPGSVILFSINSDSEPDFAKFIGSMILSDLTNVSARRRNIQIKNQVQVYIDEFQAIPPSSVTSLLEKARESSMAITLAQQSFEQIAASAAQNGENHLNSILDTCSNFIIHSGMTESSAERVSKVLGKHWITKYRGTNKNKSFFLSVNFGNKRTSNVQTYEEEYWVYPPREFMVLSSPTENNKFRSTAVIVNKNIADKRYKKNEGAVARKTLMVPDSRVLDSYYDPDFRLSEEILKGYEFKKKPQSTVVRDSSKPIKSTRTLKEISSKAVASKKKIAVIDSEPLEEDEGDFQFSEELTEKDPSLTPSPTVTESKPTRKRISSFNQIKEDGVKRSSSKDVSSEAIVMPDLDSISLPEL